MNTDNFERCQRFVAAAEGGANFDIVNGKPVLKPKNRNDRGGPTKYGITWGSLSKAYSQGIVGHNDITQLTRYEADAIYKVNYWLASRADKMPWPVCLAHYDCAVNCGVGGAAKQLQRALSDTIGGVTIDGVIGPASLAAIGAAKPEVLADAYLKVRAAYYNGLVSKTPSQEVFLNGWLARLERLRVEAGL